MTGERLGNLGVLVLHGINYFNIPVNIDSICEIFESKNPKKMCSPSVLYYD